MPTEPRVDQYIAKAPDFAKPILQQLRKIIHEVCPEINEDIKWSRPAFLYRQKILCGIVAFKAHCSFYFFQPEITEKLREGKTNITPGSLDRITQISDLPPVKDLFRYIREAVRLLEVSLSNPVPRKRATQKKPEASIPDDLAEALAKNKKAARVFEDFSASHRREYIEWITEAKRDGTRQKRIATALAWLAEGKPRNWKYINC